jgi:hypothetical protein
MLLQLLEVAFGNFFVFDPIWQLFSCFCLLFFCIEDVMNVLASQKWIRPLVSHVSKSTNYNIFQLLELQNVIIHF